MGLQLLEREKAVFKGEQDAQPDFSGKEYLLERQLKPEARKDIIEKLAAANITPTSMMDISDGLSSELLHICSQSNAGCRVYEEHGILHSGCGRWDVSYCFWQEALYIFQCTEAGSLFLCSGSNQFLQ